MSSNSANYYDVIIVGSGIAGLYSAYNIKQMSPNTSFMVLEKYKKKWIGGRINNEEFYGTTVVTGAGIGRKEKDYLLVELLDKMGIKYSDFAINMNYIVKKRVAIGPIVKELRQEYRRQSEPVTTVRHFAKG
jgi:protoporphyrinogen oxidase